MKNTNRIRVAFVAISMVAFFGSCSRETTSINRINKLDNAQFLANVKTSPTVKESEISAQVCMPANEINNDALIMPSTQKTIEIQTVSVKKTMNHTLVASFTKKAEKVILKQATVVSHLATNHAIASTTSPKDGGGLLGLAITCLIVGIILFFLGFASLGTLFWTIGIILLVVAIIFFVLWMVGRAISN